MNIDLQPILTRLKKELTDLYGDRLQNLTLFGSQARGDAEPGSDIDVLVVLKPPVNPGEEIKRTGKAIADISLDYDVVISCLFMQELRTTGDYGQLNAVTTDQAAEQIDRAEEFLSLAIQEIGAI